LLQLWLGIAQGVNFEVSDKLCSDNENKYRITCPKCKRITLTYDINNLLLSSSCSVTRGFST